METLVTVNVVIFVIAGGIAVAIGLDLKKWYSWLIGAYGFLTFFLVGLVVTGSIHEAVKAGALSAFITMFGGATTRWNKELTKKWLREYKKKER